jgi:hypothetical protein
MKGQGAVLSKDQLKRLKEVTVESEPIEDYIPLHRFATWNDLAFGREPDVEIGELFYHTEVWSICARTEDTNQGQFSSVLVARPDRPYTMNEHSVSDRRLEALQQFIRRAEDRKKGM